MATVPGNPNEPTQLGIRPTQADLLIAAGIMHQQGKFNAPPASNVDTDIRMQLLMRDPEKVEGPTSKPLVPGQSVPDERLGVPGKRDVRGI